MNIYEAISAVMAELEPIGKNKRNAQQGFAYRGIDDVMNALQPLLAKHHIFVVPEVQEQQREERQASRGGVLLYSICRVKYTFYAEDGSSVSAVVIGEGMDSGDKATNKALSVAFKYACFQVFCIPTEEMSDPDAEAHEVQPQSSGRKSGGHGGREAGREQSAEASAAQPEVITKEQVKELADLCQKKWGAEANRMYKAVTGLNHMHLTQSQYADVLAKITES